MVGRVVDEVNCAFSLFIVHSFMLLVPTYKGNKVVTHFICEALGLISIPLPPVLCVFFRRDILQCSTFSLRRIIALHVLSSVLM